MPFSYFNFSFFVLSTYIFLFQDSFSESDIQNLMKRGSQHYFLLFSFFLSFSLYLYISLSFSESDIQTLMKMEFPRESYLYPFCLSLSLSLSLSCSLNISLSFRIRSLSPISRTWWRWGPIASLSLYIYKSLIFLLVLSISFSFRIRSLSLISRTWWRWGSPARPPWRSSDASTVTRTRHATHSDCSPSSSDPDWLYPEP